MKYVAFLDILGFKDNLKKMTQTEARQFIGHFSATAYAVWRDYAPHYINGYLVSDSFIIYTDDCNNDCIKDLMELVDLICKNEFSKHSILIRGAIAKGEFDRLEAREMSSLKKGLIVGQAYIDAYLLEGSMKTIGIILSKDVWEDIQSCDLPKKIVSNVLVEGIRGADNYVFRYLTCDYLLESQNLKNFIELAQVSGWLPHYYNTLYLSIKNEHNSKKVHQLFTNILDLVSVGNPGEHWRKVDLFISNAFQANVFSNFQTRLLKYIRTRLFT